MKQASVKNVKVYSTPTCPWCHRAKQFLRDKGVPFQDLNVAENTIAREEMVSKSGQIGVPVLEIGSQLIVGFDMSEIALALSRLQSGANQAISEHAQEPLDASSSVQTRGLLKQAVLDTAAIDQALKQ